MQPKAVGESAATFFNQPAGNVEREITTTFFFLCLDKPTIGGESGWRRTSHHHMHLPDCSITTDEATGQMLRTANDAKPGQRLKTKLRSGEVRSVVEG